MPTLLLIAEFFAKWRDEGRFPREELRIRPAIAFAFGLTILALAIALLVHQARS